MESNQTRWSSVKYWSCWEVVRTAKGLPPLEERAVRKAGVLNTSMRNYRNKRIIIPLYIPYETANAGLENNWGQLISRGRERV